MPYRRPSLFRLERVLLTAVGAEALEILWNRKPCVERDRHDATSRLTDRTDVARPEVPDIVDHHQPRGRARLLEGALHTVELDHRVDVSRDPQRGRVGKHRGSVPRDASRERDVRHDVGLAPEQNRSSAASRVTRNRDLVGGDDAFKQTAHAVVLRSGERDDHPREVLLIDRVLRLRTEKRHETSLEVVHGHDDEPPGRQVRCQKRGLVSEARRPVREHHQRERSIFARGNVAIGIGFKRRIDLRRKQVLDQLRERVTNEVGIPFEAGGRGRVGRVPDLDRAVRERERRDARSPGAWVAIGRRVACAIARAVGAAPSERETQ